jgi:hypothetical protein
MALLAAVARLNPDGRGSITGTQAAEAAGLDADPAELDELIRSLVNHEPPRLAAYPPTGTETEWQLLRLPD